MAMIRRCCKTSWCCGCATTSHHEHQLLTVPPNISEFSVEELEQLFLEVEKGMGSDRNKIHMTEQVEKRASKLESWIMKNFTEVTIGAQISRDVFNALGNMHWTGAGLTVIAMGLNMALKMHENKEQCTSIMKDALEIWKWIMKPLLEVTDGTSRQFMRESVSLIIEAYVLCNNLINSGKLKSFTLVNSHENKLKEWKTNLDSLWSRAPAVVNVEILKKLSVPIRKASAKDATRTVGLEERKRHVMKLLNLDNKEVTRVVVLHGMGGVGKSTLGDAVYNQVSFSFSGARRCQCRIELGENPRREHITHLQKEMVRKLTGQSFLVEEDSKAVQDELREVLMDKNRDPIFIYIDNVLQRKDLEDFLPLDIEQVALPKGSRWLVTTRDHSVCTDVFELNRGLEVKQFAVRIMNDEDAQKLFFWHAFQEEEPSKEKLTEYDDGQGLITKMVESICGNLPLALKVLGRSLVKKNVATWRKKYNELERHGMLGSLEQRVSNVIMSSYNTLDDETKTAFLMICVCFVDGRYSTASDVVESILPRGASTSRLIELCLLELVIKRGLFSTIKIHDLIRTCGYEMAVKNKCAPAKMPTCKQDLDKLSWSTIKWLRVPALEDGIDAEFLGRCRDLEVLLLETHVNGDIVNTPHDHLKVIITNSRCPLELVEKLKNLVYLEVQGEMQEFPVAASTRSLEVLRYEKGAGSIHKEFIDLHKTTLRKLYCPNIEEFSHPYFCQQMSKLQRLVITDFKGSNLPEEIQELASLEALWIESECLASIPHSLAKLTRLQMLRLELPDLEEFPSGVLGAFKQLEFLFLDFERVTSVPMQEIGQLASLEGLALRIPSVERLTTHEPDDQLQTVLMSLKLDKLQSFWFQAESMCSLEGVQLNCPSLQEFQLFGCRRIQVLPLELFTKLTNLHTLMLVACESFEELPAQLGNVLLSLQKLVVFGCTSLKAIPDGLMKSVEGLVLIECPAVLRLPHDLDEEKACSMKFLCCERAYLSPAMFALPNVLGMDAGHNERWANLAEREVIQSALSISRFYW